MPKIQFVVKLGRKYSTIYAPDGKTVYVELERTAGNVIQCAYVSDKIFHAMLVQSARSIKMKEAINEAMEFTRSHLS